MAETQYLFPEGLFINKGIILENKTFSKIISKKKKKINKIKKIFLNVFSFIFIMIGVYLYYITLRNVCEGTQAQCLAQLDSSIFYLMGIQMIVSVLILEISIILIIKKIISFYHLIYIIILYSYFVHFHDTGSELHHHGSYNKIIFYFLIISIGIILAIFYTFYFLLIKHYYRTFLIIIAFFAIIILTIRQKLYKGCYTNWSNSLNGITIENDPSRDKCYFIHPKKCWINLLDGLFDVSKILGETCENFRKDEKKELFKYLSPDLQNSYNLAYPITIHFDWNTESLFKEFYNYVMEKMINLDTFNTAQNKNENILEPEVYIKFDKVTQLGHIEMNIKRNETLVKERQKIFKNLEKDKLPRYKNILFIFIDSLSRAHFIRKMKKTQKFLEQYYGYNDKYEFYQMVKFHSLLFFTMPNVNPMFYGESMFNKNGTHLIRAFKEKGFITAQCNNICGRELYDLEKKYNLNLDYEDFDHENIAMFCDPNYFKNESPYTAFIGPYALKRRCLYGKDTFEYIFEYAEKFWQAYNNEPKFLRLAFQEAHEGTGEVVTLLDNALYDFLIDFQNRGYLDNTAIFFVSDHGNNMFGFNEIFRFEDYMLEKSLPSWFMLLPKCNNNTEVEIIKSNQQKLVTAYDIHETLIDILNLDKNSNYRSKKGKSIYKPINSKERNCNFYQKEIGSEWCRCLEYK